MGSEMCIRDSLMYILSDESGEIHFPKDAERRELEFQQEQVAAFRKKIAADAKTLIDQGAPLSSGWFSSLGLMQQALVVQAAEEQGKAPRVLKEKPSKRKRKHYEIECILEERRSSGRAGTWYLVRWAGCAARRASPPPACSPARV